MVRLLIGCSAIAACYHPQPSAGAPCNADHACPDPLICRSQTMTCETSDTPVDASVDGDAAPDLDAHLHASPGWSIHVLADLTGAVPYNATDYTDGVTTMEVHDNAPNGVTALYAPFTAAFAVTAGRSIIEVSSAGATTVHDYRPAMPDMMGPDNIYRLAFGAPADTGPRLWLGAPSLNGGDGLYAIDDTWALKRDNALNNITGVTFDPTGAYDNTTIGVIYFIDQNGIERRDTATTHTLVSPGASDHDDLAMTPTAIFSVLSPATGPCQLVRIATGTHAVTTVATETVLDIAEGGAVSGTSVTAIRNETDLVVYGAASAVEVGATTTDPAWHWIDATRPRAPHPLAGSIIIVESNRTLDIDRLLVATPP